MVLPRPRETWLARKGESPCASSWVRIDLPKIYVWPLIGRLMPPMAERTVPRQERQNLEQGCLAAAQTWHLLFPVLGLSIQPVIARNIPMRTMRRAGWLLLVS